MMSGARAAAAPANATCDLRPADCDHSLRCVWSGLDSTCALADAMPCLCPPTHASTPTVPVPLVAWHACLAQAIFV